MLLGSYRLSLRCSCRSMKALDNETVIYVITQGNEWDLSANNASHSQVLIKMLLKSTCPTISCRTVKKYLRRLAFSYNAIVMPLTYIFKWSGCISKFGN